MGDTNTYGISLVPKFICSIIPVLHGDGDAVV